MRNATAPVLAATTLLGTVGMLVGASHAAAATCSTVTIAGPVVKTLTVSSATVPVGGCVVFTNDALAKVTVTVTGGGFSSSSATLATLASSAPFTARTVGSDGVSVTGSTLVLTSSGSGTLTVTAAPKSTTSPATKPSHKPSGPSGHSGSTIKSGGTSTKGSGTSGKAGSAAKSGSAKKSSGGKVSGLSSVAPVALPPFPHFPSREFTATRSVGSAPQIAGDPAGSPAPLPVNPTEATLPKPTQVQLADVSSSVKSQNRALPVTIAILMVLAVSTAYGRTVLRRPSAVDNGPGSAAGI